MRPVRNYDSTVRDLFIRFHDAKKLIRCSTRTRERQNSSERKRRRMSERSNGEKPANEVLRQTEYDTMMRGVRINEFMANQESENALAYDGGKRHSVQGVISFLLAITLLTALLALILILGPSYVWAMRQHMGFGSASVVLGCGTAMGAFLILTGIGLGLSGLAKPDSKRFYSVLGIIGNLIWAAIIILLMLVD